MMSPLTAADAARYLPRLLLLKNVQQGFLSHPSHSLVWANKLWREAAVAMGVTGAGEGSPVVPRLQHGRMGLFAFLRRRV